MDYDKIFNFYKNKQMILNGMAHKINHVKTNLH